jgi:hypothetical protein
MVVCHLSLQSDDGGPTSISCTAPAVHRSHLSDRQLLFRTHKSTGRLQNLVRPPQLAILALQLGDPLCVDARRRRRGRPGRRVPGLVAPYPVPQRLGVDAQLGGDRAIAPRPGPSSRSRSRAIATARSFSSAGYLLTAAMLIILHRTLSLQRTQGWSTGRAGSSDRRTR